MKIIDGREYATRDDLARISGYRSATLRNLWADRQANGHPPARKEGRTLHWDRQEWERWFRDYQLRRKGVDRSGDPDEELSPAEQARVLGINISAISHYRDNPPPGWPPPVRTEVLPGGRVREFRTRRQLQKYAASAPRAGAGGRRPVEAQERRVALAAEALAAGPGRKAKEVAAALAERHGGSLSVWQKAVTAARKQG
ncbi:hypothetical protein ACFQWA_27990 [Streptomyces thermogriseus]|uniref:Helix-turn-helix domain-containing protein n=1 Tax=Streptomyces thermogriseus TaxID=75292 RepID=A0ABN1T116_9ACTN